MDFEYTGNWWAYDIDGSELLVAPVCPECHKFIKCGTVSKNGMDQMKYEGFICKTHGEIQPETWWRDDE